MLDDHDRHVRYTVPDSLLSIPNWETTPGVWMTDEPLDKQVLLQVPGVGAFVRALLPVRLTGGFAVTFGLWLAVDPADLKRAYELWWEPEYQDLAFDGWLANDIPVWGLVGTPVRAAVRSADQTPYCVESSDETLAAVLRDEWAHDLILEAVISSVEGRA